MANDLPESAKVATDPTFGDSMSWMAKLRWSVERLNGDGPQPRLPLFRVLSLCAVVTIIGLSSIGIGWLYRTAMIDGAEAETVSVGQTIFANERENLVVRDSSGNEALHVPADRIRDIDGILRNYLEPFHIHKIKIFSGDKRVVYSSDHGLIGRRDTGNETLDRVLRERHIDSTATQKNQFTELGGRVVANRHIVETYLPIVSGERVLGAFEVYRDITSLQEAIERAIYYTAVIVTVAVALSVLALYLTMRRGAATLLAANRQMEELASTDPLTHVLTRRALIHQADREIAGLKTASVARAPEIGLVMLDIDHLKRIDHEHGQAAGVLVLQTVAKRLDTTTRKRDLAGRYGGEEFLLVLPATTRPEAIALAERLRAAIADTPVALPDGKQIALTTSLGVARFDMGDPDFDRAVHCAEEALQRAKQSGRNWVRVAD